MPNKPATQQQLLAENEALRVRLAQAEASLREMRSDEVDALVVSDVGGVQLFAPANADQSFRILVGEMSEGALTMTAQGVIVYANRHLAGMLKTPLEKLMGSTVHTWIAPGSQPILQSLLEKGADEERRAELVLAASDGTGMPVHLSVSNLPIEGRADAYCLVAFDLTEHKRIETIAASESVARELLAAANQSRGELLHVIEEKTRAQQSLQESESKYKRLIESSPDIIYMFSAKRGGIYFSPKVSSVLGYSVEHLYANPFLWSESIFAEDRAAVAKAIEGLKTGAPYAIEYRIKNAEGEWRWLHDRSIGSRVENGDFIIEGLAMDITERKAAEVKMRVLSRAMDQSPVSTVITNSDNRIEYVNPAFERITGYTLAEVLGQNPRILQSGKTLRAVYKQMWEALTAGDEWHGELCNRRKNGELFWEFAAISGVKSEAGGIERYIAVKEDITARKAADAARAEFEAQSRESQKMQAIGTLAGGIAHDFNNIVTAMLGNTELARQDAAGNPAVLESLKEIDKAARRARDLVQQILSFSRRQPTERKVIALASIVEESVRLLRSTLPARINLVVDCAPDVPSVFADATQIEQVLLNLATNAMQAMQGRKGRISIRLDTLSLDEAAAKTRPALRALGTGRVVRLAVSDDGSGMDAAMIERIFEPFFTTKPAGEGTGLGLSVVHGIVEAHGGVITVESRLGSGTSFTVYLPVAKVQPGASQGDRRASTEDKAAVMGAGQRILYLDDDEALVFMVKRLLERRGYRISDHTDQGEALAALRADPAGFDLVVTDYNMPGMSGLDVAREVRAIRADLPVVIASGFVDDALREQANGAGAREVIFKANASGELCETLARLVPTAGEKSKPS